MSPYHDPLPMRIFLCRFTLQTVDSTLQVDASHAAFGRGPRRLHAGGLSRSPNFPRMSDLKARRMTLTTSPPPPAPLAAPGAPSLRPSYSSSRLSLRPPSSTDAWYMLQLLSSVPFMTSLPFSSTIELLEVCQVQTCPWGTLVVGGGGRGRGRW